MKKQKIKHINNANCPKCEEIFARYPGFDAFLKDWFKKVQSINPDAHISHAGRGRKDQEEFFLKGTSKARYGQSAHNYNAAIDLFRLEQTGISYSRIWFEGKIYPLLKPFLDKINWYGLPGSPYFELPHFEVKNWKELVAKGVLKLVE